MKSNKLLTVVLALSFANAFAQSQDQVLNSDPINVDGYLQEKQVTDGELEQIKGEIRKQKNEVMLNKDKSRGYKELSKTTEKLSETTEEYIDEKKSAQKEIAEYNKKIKCLMEENPGKDCDKYVRNRRNDVAEVQQEVAVQQAAAVSVAPAPVAPADPDAAFEEIKLIPFAGATQYQGEREELEAELAAGLRLESNLSSRFSMGIGLNFAQLKTNDFATSMFSNNNWHNGYVGLYGQNGREIQFRNMGVDIYGKFFITKGERFRPFIGAGLGYNRAQMKYTNNESHNINQYQFGNENYTTSFATGTLTIGSEIMITKGFGLNIEGSYVRGLGSSLSSKSSQNMVNSPDQQRLRELGNEIINSNQFSLFAGAVILF